MKTSETGILNKSDIYFATPSNLARKLFFYITCLGHFYYENNYKLWRDDYDSYLIMYILRGSAKIYYEDRMYVAKKDDIVFMDCHKPHGYQACGDLETLWFHFDGQNTKDFHKAILDMWEGGIISLKETYVARSNIQKLYDCYHEKWMLNEATQSAYITKILAEFFPTVSKYSDQKSSIIEETLQFINRNYGEKLSLKILAGNVALSEFYFSRLFKKETGFTPHEYIMNTRITKAKIFLKSKKMTIKELAFSCGFSSESAFVNAFKKHTGMTPGEFRRLQL